MKGLDLSKFKKIKHEEGHTILKHGDGHEIKILHTALSPKMQKELEAIPLAEGTPVPISDPDTLAKFSKSSGFGQTAPEKPKSPVSTQIVGKLPGDDSPPTQEAVPNPNQAKGGMVGAKQAGMYESGTPDAPVSAADADPGGQAAPPQTDPSTATGQDQPEQHMSFDPLTIQAQQPQAQTPAPAPASGKEQFKKFLLDDSANTEADLMMGHIQPETYSDLYGKRDTLGKMGTLFGLLVGSMGSAVSHQPNIIMGMMDKEIERDLQAQQNNATNKNDFLRIAQNNDLIQNQAREAGVRADAGSLANAMITTSQTTFKHLSDLVNKAPPGSPERAARMQAAQLYYNTWKQNLPNAMDTILGVSAANQGSTTTSSQTLGQPSQSGNKGVLSGLPGRTAQDLLGDEPQTMLAPGAKATLDTFNPYNNPANAPKWQDMKDQYNSVFLADQQIKNLKPAFDYLSENATNLGTLANSFDSLKGTGTAGLPGAVIHGSIISAAKQQQAYRNYMGKVSAIEGEIASALKGTNVSAEDVRNMVENNLPLYNDTPEGRLEKRRNIEGLIKRSIGRGMLQGTGIIKGE
jgi:hypothetical protein